MKLKQEEIAVLKSKGRSDEFIIFLEEFGDAFVLDKSKAELMAKKFFGQKVQDYY